MTKKNMFERWREKCIVDQEDAVDDFNDDIDHVDRFVKNFFSGSENLMCAT